MKARMYEIMNFNKRWHYSTTPFIAKTHKRNYQNYTIGIVSVYQRKFLVGGCIYCCMYTSVADLNRFVSDPDHLFSLRSFRIRIQLQYDFMTKCTILNLKA